ncbi:MAG: efflux transporter outer membrane subunit, partial [Proteobacteria bacterium]|nr:efflux transporter outer membrane subunit [Pseudomonadota bacterium]
ASRADAVPPGLRATLAQFDVAIALARNQLAALAGKGPDRGLSIGPVPGGVGPAAHAHGLPPDLPLDLLGRRPDLAAARWRVESAAGEVEVAKKRFLPNVNLLAFAGVASLGLDRLLAAGSGIGGVGPAVRVPLFSAGGLQAGLRGREADYDLAVERYNELLLDAVREVADQVQTRRVLDAERSERRLAYAATEQARRFALERYRAGIASYLEVLDAEAPLFALQRADTDLGARALLAEVGLYRALGGGYADGGR